MSTIATQWALVWMSVIGVVFFFFSRELVMLFTSEPDVVAFGAAGLQVMAFTQPFFAIAIVQSSALRGTGNSQYPLRVGAATMWAAVILGALAVRFIGGGLEVLWGRSCSLHRSKRCCCGISSSARLRTRS